MYAPMLLSRLTYCPAAESGTSPGTTPEKHDCTIPQCPRSHLGIRKRTCMVLNAPFVTPLERRYARGRRLGPRRCHNGEGQVPRSAETGAARAFRETKSLGF